jgi:exopolyphosphatase/guanosine-5'-triphosphate,3'-diphosphate pyrophosphatase
MRLDGMKEDRRAVIGGGLSVLRAMFRPAGYRPDAGRAGRAAPWLFCDLLDRRTGQHRRAILLRAAPGHQVRRGRAQAQRVSAVAHQPAARPACGPAPAELDERAHLRKLHWAAQLHEIGSHISHSDYHKHGAYILDNADAPGFALPELHRLSLLVLGHRGKLRKLDATTSRTVSASVGARWRWPAAGAAAGDHPVPRDGAF